MSTLPIVLSILVNPFADHVVSYDAGKVDTPGYDDPAAAIGEPSRFTGEGVWPGVVSPFNAPWLADEIVSIGAGGHLTLQFDEPIVDDPTNPYGIDLLIFGNTGMLDGAYPAAIVGGVFSADGGSVELSSDGKTWFTVQGALADGLWPTNGYTDSEPYGAEEGSVETSFTLPIDPRLTLDMVMNLNCEQLVNYYGNSGGGNGIDIATTGLTEVSYVRISAGKLSPEIDAVVDVDSQLAGDADLNGVVNVNDLLMVIESFGPLPIGGPLVDFNQDYNVDINDLLTVIGNWS